MRSLIMEGYDVTVVGSFYGHPAFLRRFGVPTTGNDIGYAIPAPWQSGLSNGASAGGIIGLFVSRLSIGSVQAPHFISRGGPTSTPKSIERLGPRLVRQGFADDRSTVGRRIGTALR